jgi:peptidoglycan/xylan/chitin deacetylase (PgdA/CDA1 family)
VLQYRKIAEPEGKGQRTPSNLRADLEQFLAAGYYPVNLRNLVESRLSSVPAGKRPIVLTFDGSTEDQFRLLPDGTVDPNTAVGILKAFHDTHPADWPLRATFCVAPYSDEPDKGPFGSQQLSAQKLGLLAQWGMEVALGIESRGNLSKMSAEEVQGELASGQARLKKWLPDTDISSLCLADGSIPKDTSVLAAGESAGESYAFKATAGTVKGLAPSPRSSKFDPYRIPRIQVTKAELDRFLKLANQPNAYYASPGE